MERTPLVHLDGSPIRVLIVDDEPLLRELLTMAVRAEGWEPHTASDGQGALALVRDVAPDLIVLDVMMPGIDGIEVVSRLRARDNDVPVLFLTAKDDVSDRITGLSAGGDDYVTKPFSLEEVIVRLRGMIRRNVLVASVADPVLIVGDLMLNEQTYEVTRAGTPLDLTATEFSLLRYLMENPRAVLSKSQILDRVWEYDFGGRASVVELYISYLRKKLEALGPRMIHTFRGVGYSIRPADE
ncbi:response regulator transcription factor [Nesterenkonia muleiensis]|uniref:response regulator transcription factor n=1 Tax=Nesterenkonia muleiensis TaxID=2282648 RepID=UPI000E716D02|nr:response regulator transcription factor [Nesterenkonia muleiensis]